MTAAERVKSETTAIGAIMEFDGLRFLVPQLDRWTGLFR